MTKIVSDFKALEVYFPAVKLTVTFLISADSPFVRMTVATGSFFYSCIKIG